MVNQAAARRLSRKSARGSLRWDRSLPVMLWTGLLRGPRAPAAGGGPAVHRRQGGSGAQCATGRGDSAVRGPTYFFLVGPMIDAVILVGCSRAVSIELIIQSAVAPPRCCATPVEHPVTLREVINHPADDHCSNLGAGEPQGAGGIPGRDPGGRDPLGRIRQSTRARVTGANAPRVTLGDGVRPGTRPTWPFAARTRENRPGKRVVFRSRRVEAGRTFGSSGLSVRDARCVRGEVR